MPREGISTRLRSWGLDCGERVGEGRVLVEKAGGEEAVDWMVLVVQSAGGVGAELLVGEGGEGEEAVTLLHP